MTEAILCGCPNCGKTALFNALTGSTLKTGNFPGVTVECKTGKVKGCENCRITDLPGVYSLSPCSDDEKVAVEHLENQTDGVIVNVADGTNLQRSLYLTLALAALGRPMVMAVNMIDELKKLGGKVDISRLSQQLGIPAVTVSALKGEGIDTLKELISKAKVPLVAVKPDEIPKTASNLAKDVWIPPIRLQKTADKLLFGRYTAIPAFICIFLFVFWFVFGFASPYLSDVLEALGTGISNSAYALCVQLGFPQWLKGLISAGIIGGVCKVLQFLPSVLLFFLMMSLLEDTGYMARAVCIFDRIFASVGLSGRIVMPLLTGFGCTVPAVMACRTLGSEKEKKAVMYMLPFVSCTAKIPLYAIMCRLFFPNHTVVVISSIYISGVLIAFLTAFLLRNKQKPSTFIMELPPYRIPSIKSTYRLLKRKAYEFFAKACSIILLSSAVVWFLSSYDSSFSLCTPESSMLCSCGKLFSPLFKPLGFGSWQAVSAIMTGFGAKEAVASTLSLLCDITQAFNTSSALSFMVFVMLYTPCIPACTCIKKETDRAFALSLGIRQLIIAYTASFLIFRLCSAL